MFRITRDKGFSVVSLMVTILIIFILAAIAVASFRQMKIRANEAAAVSMLQKLASAFETYRAMNGNYPAPADFATLRAALPTLIDAQFIDTAHNNVGQRRGYRFVIETDTDVLQTEIGTDSQEHAFMIYANPLQHKITGINSYMISQRGSLYSASDYLFYDAVAASLQAPPGGWENNKPIFN